MIGTRLIYDIKIYSNEPIKNNFGAVSTEKVFITDVKADIKRNIGRAVNKEDTIISQTETIFYIRNYPVIKYDYIIEFEEEEYKILAIDRMLDRSGQIIKTLRNGKRGGI